MIKVKKLHRDAIVPKFAHKGDSGFDLYTSCATVLEPYSKGIAKTGLAVELPENYGIMIRPRSGISVKGCPSKVFKGEMTTEGLKVSTSEVNIDIRVIIGTVDNAYRGEIGIIVYNNSEEVIEIPKHTRLAQGVLERVYNLDFIEVEELDTSVRGEEGFGSTGVK